MNVFLVVFLTVQVLVPLRGFIQSPYDTRGRFSWNMYAKKHDVKALYAVVRPGAQPITLDYKSYFNNPVRATLVHHRDSLPKFHAFLCRIVQRDYPGAQLQGWVVVRVNEGEEVELVSRGVDLCTAPNHGVNPP